MDTAACGGNAFKGKTAQTSFSGIISNTILLCSLLSNLSNPAQYAGKFEIREIFRNILKKRSIFFAHESSTNVRRTFEMSFEVPSKSLRSSFEVPSKFLRTSFEVSR